MANKNNKIENALKVLSEVTTGNFKDKLKNLIAENKAIRKEMESLKKSLSDVQKKYLKDNPKSNANAKIRKIATKNVKPAAKVENETNKKSTPAKSEKTSVKTENKKVEEKTSVKKEPAKKENAKSEKTSVKKEPAKKENAKSEKTSVKKEPAKKEPSKRKAPSKPSKRKSR